MNQETYSTFTFMFTFMHLADAFIQSDLQCIQTMHFVSMCIPWELNPQPFALLTQCTTTEPQEHYTVGVSLNQLFKRFIRNYRLIQKQNSHWLSKSVIESIKQNIVNIGFI